MAALDDIDRVLAGLDPSIRAVVAPIVTILRMLIEALQEDLARKDARIEQLQRALYGRRSEKIIPDPKREARKRQQAQKTAEEREQERQDARAKSRATRKELPVVERKISVPDEARVCPCCGGRNLRPLGEGEVTEQIEHIPARVVRIRWVREKLACRCGEGIVTAPPPPQVREGGQYGPGFHAQVVVAKCLDSLPLHRQSRAMAREGCAIASTQLCAMFHRTADQIEPLYKALLALVPEASHVAADETPQPVLAPGKTRKGWMWTFLVERAIVYRFDPSRAGRVPQKILGNSRGVLQVDGYSGYNTVATPTSRTRAGCWAHARRKVFEVRESHRDVADPLLEDIGRLFEIEVIAAERGIFGTDAHRALRQAEARPLVDALFARFRDAATQAPPRSALGRAVAYALNQEKALRLFLTDPKVLLDNNASERALRIVALLRKNALFVGHDEGGQNLAMLLTVVGTCCLHHVEPRAYLTDVLVRMNEPGTHLDDLLPWNWKPSG